MLQYVLESDTDYLFSEETIWFMEKASEPVKKSFLSRLVESVKKIFRSVSDFIGRALDKFRGKGVVDKIKNDPKAAKTKIKTKNYEASINEGMSALNRIDKARSGAEAKKIADEYTSKRKKILSVAIPTTLLAAATLIGGGLFLKHRKNLSKVHSAIQNAEEVCEVEVIPPSQTEVLNSDGTTAKKRRRYANTAPNVKSVKVNKKENTKTKTTKEEPKQQRSRAIAAIEMKPDKPSSPKSAPSNDRVEKETQRMKVSKMTLDDMMANEKEMVNLINHAKYSSKTMVRMDKLSNHMDKQAERLIAKANDIKERLKSTDLSESERSKLTDELEGLNSGAKRMVRARRAYSRRSWDANEKTFDAVEKISRRTGMSEADAIRFSQFRSGID